MERVTWPAHSSSEHDGTNVAIVVVNSNTKELIAHLIFSMYRVLGRGAFTTIVVVDNASTDGSVELLEALHAEGLIELIRNDVQRYHGPALTQGVSWLAAQQSLRAPDETIERIWILDSDVVLLRPDTLSDALRRFDAPNVAAVGQAQTDPAYDWLLAGNKRRLPLRKLHRGLYHSARTAYKSRPYRARNVRTQVSPRNRTMLHPASLVFDPALVWRDPIPPFVEDGAPSAAFQVGIDRQGLRIVAHPFVEAHYLIHLGRGTLREVITSDDRNNRYYGWAAGHDGYHFTGQEGGEERYAAFCELFEAHVGPLTAQRLIAACRVRELLQP